MTSKDIHLPEALNAPREERLTQSGLRVAYYADRGGSGRPILFIHSINAAASSFEVKPLFDHYAGRRPVYSLDLPGFGHSERKPIRYTPELYAETIVELLTRVIGEPADLVALSLSSEFAARAALSAPERVASLVLVSPTGFSDEPLPSPGVAGVAARVLSLPLLSQGLYDLVASRRSIAYFLKRCFVGPVSEAMIDYAYATSHQPGARYAPLAFLSTRLFTPDATVNLYGALDPAVKVLAIADQDPFIRFERLEGFVAVHASWRRVRLAPNRGLPHWERPDDTAETLSQFWAG